MLTIASGARVYLASQAVDLRRGHDGLCALVRGTLDLDPYGGQLFVFVGRRGDRVKVLFWDHGGFVIYYKRLAKGRFRLPVIDADTVRVMLDGTELAMLLGGFDLAQTHRQSAWKREAA